MQRFTCCALLLAAVLWAAPARSQIFSPSDATPFEVMGISFFGPLGGGNTVFSVIVTSAGTVSQAGATTGSAAVTTAAAPGASLALNPTISGFSYTSANGATYTKTATGLLVVLSPAALSGSGPLAGHTDGLSIEIPATSIMQLF